MKFISYIFSSAQKVVALLALLGFMVLFICKGQDVTPGLYAGAIAGFVGSIALTLYFMYRNFKGLY